MQTNWKHISLLLGLLLAMTSLMGQQKWTKKGDKAFLKGNYQRCLEVYAFGIKKKEGDLARIGLAQTLLKLKRPQQAIEAFEKVDFAQLDQPTIQLAYARALMSQEQYPAAKTQILAVLNQHPDSEWAKSLLTVAGNPDVLLADSNRFSISRLPINTPKSDFSPIPYKEGLVFGSSRDNRMMVNYTSNTHHAAMVDLYFIPRLDSNRWGKARPLPGNVNTKYNDGPACFSPDGNQIYFTRNNFLGGKRGFSSDRVNKLKLLTATWEKDQKAWSTATELPFNSDEYSVGHPAISADGKTLYFVSDQPGGFGGTDLYSAELTTNGWGAVKNLGPQINTPGDELFPFHHLDGTLYFASDGHPGLGGLDLFSAVLSSNGVGTVSHLGIPLNSLEDDFGLVLDSARKTGFFSSNRGDDPQNDDLYAVEVNWPEFECFPQEETSYCYQFTENGSVKDPESDGFTYQWDLGDGTFKNGLSVRHCYADVGLYEVRLNLIDTVYDFLFLNEAEYQLEIKHAEQVYIEGPKALLPEEPADFSGLATHLPGVDIQAYYWDLGDGRRRRGAEIEVSYTQPGTYSLTLGIIGRDAEGVEVKACASRKIEVLDQGDFVAYFDSLASLKQTHEGGPSLRPEDLLLASTSDSLSAAQVVPKQTSLMNQEVDVYRVQIAQSPYAIPLDSSYFKGLQQVQEFSESDQYIYTLGEAKDPLSLTPVFRQAVDLDFDAVIVVGFKDDHIVNGHDSTFFVRFKEVPQQENLSVVRGRLTDLEGNPLQTEIIWEDLKKGTVYATATSNEDGRFYMELPNGTLYGITAEIDDYFTFSEHVDLSSASDPQALTVDLQVVSVEEMIKSGKAYTLKNIFFDHDDYRLRPESKKSLDKLARILIEYPGLNVEIRGHTDSKGADAYNLRLSKRRASEVLKYLILSGFDLEVTEILANGYGESLPISPNTTEEGRQLNRRVEFRFFQK